MCKINGHQGVQAKETCSNIQFAFQPFSSVHFLLRCLFQLNAEYGRSTWQACYLTLSVQFTVKALVNEYYDIVFYDIFVMIYFRQ